MHSRRLVVVGGVAGGASAAARARRLCEQCEIIVFERGPHVSSLHLHPNSHAGYFPGAEPIALKVLFAPESGRLLGAQAVGRDGVDKRIDVLATALKGAMTVHDLAELELASRPRMVQPKTSSTWRGWPHKMSSPGTSNSRNGMSF